MQYGKTLFKTGFKSDYVVEVCKMLSVGVDDNNVKVRLFHKVKNLCQTELIHFVRELREDLGNGELVVLLQASLSPSPVCERDS